MLNKRFIFFFAGVALMGVLAMAPFVFAAPPGGSQLKIFTRDRATIESAVNDWLAGQTNIAVDQIKANAYGGDYAVIINYRGGGTGRVATRIKIFDSNALTDSVKGSNETPEMRGQEFVSLLGANQIIRSADILVGSGPWDIFVVYDEYNPIPRLTSEAPSVPIIEKIKSFVDNLVNPADTSPAATEAPIAPSEEQSATTSITDATATSSTSAATTTPQAEEIILPPQQGEATSSPTAITSQASQTNIFLAAIGLLRLGTDNIFVANATAIGILFLLAFILSRINKISENKKTKR